MPRLVRATDDQVANIYRESHALWGTGLTLAAYLGLWDEISRLPWAARHAEFLVWGEPGGPVLSSLKLYHPLVRVAGRIARATVLGAVFTPRLRRGRGHASKMLSAVLDRARLRGDPLLLLFSDIGTLFYERLGFHPLPATEQWGRIPRAAGSPAAGWEIRETSEADHDAIRRAHHASCLRRPLAVIRDEQHWEFLRARTKSFFSRLGDPELRPRSLVVSRHGRFTGYLVTVEGRGEWSVREVGAVKGDPGTMAEVFRVGAHEARSAGLGRFCGWLPPEMVPRLGEWKIDSQPRRRAVPMALPLDPALDTAPLASPRRGFFPHQDQF
jgi:GNAT superfamily N-acetyltransferase